ncbi:hypothetical protein Tco_0706247 [Tanacetum coccineum]|uniref:Uncharacterized protein n=1 Tax=Tanacetum coccineum TaxID=301880 RepID=A0ABQ4Y6X2_9ASTR
MDSIIPLRQKNTLAEYMILSGADNRPPCLEKDCVYSGKVEWNLHEKQRALKRTILESEGNCLLLCPTNEEMGDRTKKYAELFAAEKI